MIAHRHSIVQCTMYMYITTIGRRPACIWFACKVQIYVRIIWNVWAGQLRLLLLLRVYIRYYTSNEHICVWPITYLCILPTVWSDIQHMYRGASVRSTKSINPIANNKPTMICKRFYYGCRCRFERIYIYIYYLLLVFLSKIWCVTGLLWFSVLENLHFIY